MKLAYLPPGRVLGMSLVIPVSGFFTTQPILSSQNQGQPLPNLYLAVPVPSQLLPRPQDSPGGQGLFPWSSQCTWRFLFLRVLGPNSTQLSLVLLASTFMFPCILCSLTAGWA